MSSHSIADDALRDALAAFRRMIAARNRREWIACAVVAVGFAWIALRGERFLYVISALEVVLAAGFIAWKLHHDGRVRLSASVEDDPALAELYAAELRRHAELLRRAPFWYVLPLAVGLCGLTMAGTLESSRMLPLSVLLTPVVIAGLIAWANVRAARDLQRRADDVVAGLGDEPASRQESRARKFRLALAVFFALIAISIAIRILAR